MKENGRKAYLHRKRRNICYLLVLGWLSFLLCFFNDAHVASEAVYAAEDGIEEVILRGQHATMQIDIGMDGIARYGRTLLISGSISDSKDTFNGELRITCINTDGSNKQYCHTFAGETGMDVMIAVPIPLNGYTDALLFEYVENGTTTAKQKVKLLAVNYGEYEVIGLLSQDTEALSYFKSFGNQTIALTADTLPATIYGLDFMDMIVIDDFDTAILSESQIDALIEFVESGRTIVFGTGSNGMESLQAFANAGLFSVDSSEEEMVKQRISLVPQEEADALRQKISNYENERNTILSRNERRKEEFSGIQEMYAGESMLSEDGWSAFEYQTAEKELRSFSLSDAILVSEMGTQPLLWKVYLGEGVMEIASFSLSERAGNITFYQAGLVSSILENQSGAGINRAQNESYGFSSKYLLANVLDHPDMAGMPSILVYIIVIVCYIILVGPVLYLILHKRRRQQLLYLIVPVLSILFFLLLFFVGGRTRITEPYAGYINIETYNPIEKTMQAEVSFTISIPYMKHQGILLQNTDYVVAGRDSFPYYSDYSAEYISREGDDDSEGKEYTLGVSYNDAGTSIRIQNTRAFYRNYFYTRYKAESEAPAEGDIVMTPESISGKVRNCADYDLTDVYVYCSGALMSVGEIKAGEEILVNGNDCDFIGSRDMIYFSNIILSIAEEKEEHATEEEYRKQYALQYVLGELYEEREQAYIIGFKEEPNENIPIASLLGRRGSYGNSMVVVPINAGYTSDEGAFSPYMDSYMHVIDGTVEENGTRYLFTDSITIRYRFPRKEDITAIYYSNLLNRTDLTDYVPQFIGNIYFLNKNTGQYDLIFYSGMREETYEDSNASKESSLSSKLINNTIQWRLKTADASPFYAARIKAEQLDKYLGEDRVLEVRIKISSLELMRTQILPYLSYGRETE
ncbi:MAG: hypothetical protein E7256_07490 [Lachnospiraceae bacterium]|nr:hypothetical protein [Lachnospiraceae bacterium]